MSCVAPAPKFPGPSAWHPPRSRMDRVLGERQHLAATTVASPSTFRVGLQRISTAVPSTVNDASAARGRCGQISRPTKSTRHFTVLEEDACALKPAAAQRPIETVHIVYTKELSLYTHMRQLIARAHTYAHPACLQEGLPACGSGTTFGKMSIRAQTLPTYTHAHSLCVLIVRYQSSKTRSMWRHRRSRATGTSSSQGK